MSAVNKHLDTLIKVRELLQPLGIEESPVVVETETAKVQVLKVALDELRRVHDHISNAYDQLRIKALGMIAGEVAIVTFILAADDHTEIHASDSAEHVFLGAGVFALATAAFLLISAIASGDWFIPGDMGEIEQIDNGKDNRYDTVEKFLLFLREDYLDANRMCTKIIGQRAKRVNWGLYLLLAGAIILLVLKYGGLRK